MSRAIHKMRGGLLPVFIAGSVTLTTTSATDVHNMGNINVGSSHSTKKVLVLVSSEDGNAFIVSGITVGGEALSNNAAIHIGGTREFNAEIWSGDIPSLSGSQAIVITFTGNIDAVGCSAIATHFQNSLTAEDSATVSNADSTTSVLASLSGPALGIVVAVGGHKIESTTASWSSMTERADVSTGGGGNDLRHTAAWDLGARASANETITWGTNDTNVAAAASFR